jgi:hypothetical protein
MTTLADIRDQVKNRLVLPGTTKDSEIDGCIRQAIKQLRLKRYWFLREISELTLSADSLTVDLPDNFASLISVDLIDGNNRYTHETGFALLTYERLRQQYYAYRTVHTGIPCAVALFANQRLYVSHKPSQDYTLEMVHTKQDITLPTNDADTSVWFGRDGYDLIATLAQYYVEADVLHNPQASDKSFRSALDIINQQHEFYDPGAF